MNKYKKLVSNTLIFAIGSFGSKILLLLLTRLYTGNINPGDNSTKELLEQTANFLIPIITFSIADAVIRYGIDKNFDNRKIFTSACVTEAFGIGVLLLLSPLLNFLPYTEGYVVLLVIYCITSGFRQIASQFVRARGLVRLFAMDGILATLTLFIFNVTFIAGFHLGVTGFLISVILSDLLSGLFLWGVAGLHRFFRLRYMDKKILRIRPALACDRIFRPSVCPVYVRACRSGRRNCCRHLRRFHQDPESDFHHLYDFFPGVEYVRHRRERLQGPQPVLSSGIRRIPVVYVYRQRRTHCLCADSLQHPH